MLVDKRLGLGLEALPEIPVQRQAFGGQALQQQRLEASILLLRSSVTQEAAKYSLTLP